MIGRLIDRWQYTWADIWEPLGNLPDVPIDLYNELYRVAIEKLSRKPTYRDLVVAFNDPEIAQVAFQELRGGSFKGELEVVALFEEIYEALEEFGVNGLHVEYKSLVELFLNRYNLRYRLVQPFNLLIQLPWLYADIYSELVRLNHSNSHLDELMDDFEKSFDLFTRTKRDRDLKASITRASNYAEGIAAAMSDNWGGTLGRMVDQLGVWPHEKVKESIKNLYHFCSDYPGIRHAGNKANQLRDLDAKDTILLSAMLMVFSSYMHDQLDVNQLLK